MPSLRLLSVAALAGLGAAVSVVGGVGGGAVPSDRSRTATASFQRPLAVASSPRPAPLATRAGRSASIIDVTAENARPGTRSWRIPRPAGRRAGPDAYAGSVSVLPGTPVHLSLEEPAAGSVGTRDDPVAVRVRAFRIGWYGGAGARTISDAPLGAGWLDTTGWPEGHYLLRLDAAAAARYVPLTIRSTTARGRVLLLTSPLSWQAVNPRSDGATASFERRYVTGFGAGGFLSGDLGVVQAAESTGVPLAYATDLDVADDPALLAGATAVVTGGDSLFWTAGLRSALIHAAGSGTDLAFFGAGAGTRTVSLADGGRTLRIRPDTGSAARAASSLTRGLTGLRPACTATGTSSGWRVADGAWWGYRGTGLRSGQAVPGLVGGRFDRPAQESQRSGTASGTLGVARARTTESVLLASGAAACGPQQVQQAGSYLVKASGAAVFATGTSQWACALAVPCLDRHGTAVRIPARSRSFVRDVTRTVIITFARPHAVVSPGPLLGSRRAVRAASP